ncbi:MAG TPA: acyltransferase family protein [Acidimicrobiales bacterium]|nr:acyltransferase family protein [Acidimicrobiales bacterium]
MVATSTSSARARPTIPHVEALDGLRGVAVIGVLLFHADHLAGGFLGVDLFFTLSGFLITSLLVVEHRERGRISLRAFWARRARRLLPAMLAVVAAATVVATLTLPSAEMERFGNQALLTLAYVANWGEIASSRDYWALFDAPTPLEHVWSLAIEEQFYVVWPLLVLGSVRLLGRRVGIRALVGAGLVASLVVSWVVVEGAGGVTRAYYGTDTRAASILVGAALATITAGASRRPSGVERGVAAAAVASLGALLASWVLVDGTELWLYRYGLLAHAVLTAVVIAAVSGPFGGRLGQVLRVRPLVRIGILSYGLYLWHWPVYVVLDPDRTGLEGWSLTGLRLAVSIAIATASYHLLEAPIRSQRWRIPRPALVSAGAVAATAALVVVLVWQAGPSAEERTSDLAVGAAGTEATAVAGRLLVIGNPGTVTLAREVASAGEAQQLRVRVEGEIGCVDCTGWSQRWSSVVAREQPDVVLLLAGWAGTDDRDLGDGVLRGPCDPMYDAHHREELRDVVDVLGSSGAVVVLATTAPTADGTVDKSSGCLDRISDEVTRGFPSELLDLARMEPAGARSTARWILDGLSRLTGLDQLPFVVVVGDSQALRLVEHAPPFDELDLRVGNLGALGCGLSTQSVVMGGQDIDKAGCGPGLAALPDDLAALEPDAVVVHAGVWEVLDQATDAGRIGFEDPRWADRLRANVEATLAGLAAEHHVVALSTPCFSAGSARAALGAEDLDARLAAYNEILIEEVERLGGTVVDLAGRLCPDGVAVHELDGVVLRPDGIHLERGGAQAVWPWLADELRAAVRAADPNPGVSSGDS